MAGIKTNPVWSRCMYWGDLRGSKLMTRSKSNAILRPIQLILKSVGSRTNTSASFRNHWPITSTRQNVESKSNLTVSLSRWKRKRIKPGSIWSRRSERRRSPPRALKILEIFRAKISTRKTPREVSWIWWRICTKQAMMTWSEQSPKVFQRLAQEKKFQEIRLAPVLEEPHSRCLLFELLSLVLTLH